MGNSAILGSKITHPGSIPELNDLCQLIGELCDRRQVVLTLILSGEERIVGCYGVEWQPLLTHELKMSWNLDVQYPLKCGERVWDGHLLWSGQENPVTVELLLKQVANVLDKLELVGRLSEEKELLQTVTDHLGDVVWMTSPTKNAIVFISRAYEHVWERSREELYADPLSFLLAIDDRDRKRVIAAFDKQLTGIYNEQYRIRTPSGAEKWIQDRAFPIVDATGKIKLVVGIATDITAQKEAEVIMDRQRANLILAERFKSLGEMAGGIAHEINNPLAVAHLRVQMLQETLNQARPDLSSVKEGLDVVVSMMERIGKIIKSMRTLARDSSHDEPVVKDIWDVVTDTLQFMSPRTKQSNVAFLPEKTGPCKIRCRPSEIGQALVNLVSNAYDAVADQAGSWVKLDAVEDEKFVTLRISDSGKGVPTELFYKIWDPFFSTKKAEVGNGLGLPISKTLVEKHGGSLSLDLTSENTRFLLKLPKAL